MIDIRRRNNIRTSRYDAAARRVGLNSVEDIMAWQRANGLEADGLFGAKSQALWNRLHGIRTNVKRRGTTPPPSPQKTPASDGSMLRVDASAPEQTLTYSGAPVFNYATIKDYMDAIVQEQNAKPNQYAGYPASTVSLIVEDNIKKANAYADKAIKTSRWFGDAMRSKYTMGNTRIHR